MSIDSDNAHRVAAGPFGVWLQTFRASLHGNGGTDVPCGDCVGCCVSSYSILVRPDDTAALAAIPAEYLVRAPGLQPGHRAMGYLHDGTCPMLSNGKCSVYRSRPQTCRDYDCRIFAAAGLIAGGVDKSVINKRVREWQFTYASPDDERAHCAVQAAAAFIQNKAVSSPRGRVPTTPTGIAVLATKVYSLFLDPGFAAQDESEMAAAVIAAGQRFDAETKSTA